jgi:hypothetical protein
VETAARHVAATADDWHRANPWSPTLSPIAGVRCEPREAGG